MSRGTSLGLSLLLTLLSLQEPAVAAQASQAGPRLFPRGARAPGIQETTFDSVTGAYFFTLKSETGAVVVQYRLPLRHAKLKRGVLRIEETTTGTVPMVGGGLLYRTDPPGPSGVGRLITAEDLAFSATHDPLHTATLLGHSLDPVTGLVSVTYRDEYVTGTGTVTTEKTYALRLLGKSLEIHATGDFAVRSQAAHNYAGFQFGPGDGLAQPNLALHVPYMDQFPVFVGAGGVCISRLVDWYVSNASEGMASGTPQTSGTTFTGECFPATYRDDLGDLNAPIDETVYLTVSAQVHDTFAVVDRPPSQYRAHLADRAVSQAAPGACYASNKDWVLRARGLGMADMAHIKWDWNKWPFNLNSPDLIPAAPGVPCGTIWGTQTEWLDYVNAAVQGNWTFAPYFEEAGNDPGYPNLVLLGQGCPPAEIKLKLNPAYSAANSVRDAAGNAKLGWDTNLNLAGTNLAGQGHPIEILGPHVRAGFLTAVADANDGLGGYTPVPVIGAHTDAATGLGDWIHIDQRSGSGFPRTIAASLKWREESFGALKDGMQGPLFGENSHWRYNAFETYDAGLLDGTSRKIPIHWSSAQGGPSAESKDYLVLPDFELTEVMSKASGFFGMGWESHFDEADPFQQNPPASQWGFSDAFVDAWHATLLSYGHSAYFGTNGDVPNNYWDWQRNIRSYYLCFGILQRMRASTAKQVRYVDSHGIERTLDEALSQVLTGQMDLAAPRLVLRYHNGLEFKANHSATSWSTSVLGQSWVIPSNGFVAAAPDGLLAFSAINPGSGVRCDYAFNPGHSQMIDQRGVAQSFNGFPGALLPVPASLPQFGGASDAVVHDLRTNRAIYGHGLLNGSDGLGPSPAPVSLAVVSDDTDLLSSGRTRLGLRAILTDGIGNTQDVTARCAWSSTNPAAIGVNRFGGLTMLGPGSATISATYASAGLAASRPVSAIRAPVLTPMALNALTPTKAFLQLGTDAACTTSIQLLDTSTATTITLAGRPDPAQKVHHFSLRSLTSGTTYVATPTAVNAGGLSTTGAGFTFTTP